MHRDLRSLIEDNAAELRRLHARTNDPSARLGEDGRQTQTWSDACAEFRARYEGLAFPGGDFEAALKRLVDGDRNTMEAALAFLEVRPYFFRSGYMYKKLLRYAKRAPFSKAQAQRFRVVLERVAAWKSLKHERRGAMSLEDLRRLMEGRGLLRPRA